LRPTWSAASPILRTAYIGLLLLEPTARGHGLGAAAFEAIEAQASAWPGTRYLRLGVVATTPVAQAFWASHGLRTDGHRQATPARRLSKVPWLCTPSESRTSGHATMLSRVRLRPTMSSDLDFVLSVEQDPLNLPFITPWERTQHEGAIRFPGLAPFHRRGRRGLCVGRLRDPARLPQSEPLARAQAHGAQARSAGPGVGRQCLQLLAQMAFRDLGAHRFWLDVKGRNLRAQALYASEGFVEEGRLRESVRTDTGYDSLVVMSMLESEHAALNAHR
jgi:RimJ/RimL family protein N-acetyltransferase